MTQEVVLEFGKGYAWLILVSRRIRCHKVLCYDKSTFNFMHIMSFCSVLETSERNSESVEPTHRMKLFRDA